MFRLNKKDIAFYLLEQVCLCGFMIFTLGIAFFVAMLVLALPDKLPTIMIIIIWIVGIGAAVGAVLCFGGSLVLDMGDKSRRELVRKWWKVTHLSIFLFPRDSQEAEGMAPHLREVLVGYAKLAEDAFKERDEARSNLDAMRIHELAKPADLAVQRRVRAKARNAFEKAEQKAERRHKEYLAAWDYLTKDQRDSGVGLLACLRGCNPEDFRKTIHAIG